MAERTAYSPPRTRQRAGLVVVIDLEYLRVLDFRWHDYPPPRVTMSSQPLNILEIA